VQRRHQKVLEEAPAPGMTPELRREMGEAAVAAARAVNYVGAGPVEFIVEPKPDGSMRFFFMEMNTRLQVEHPVTEAITGQDLVEWQLRVAAGEPLPLTQDQLKITGHAIEARICAENPDNNFLPATGALHVYGLPGCVSFARNSGGVRVDSGVREGDVISPFYDSMVAKLIVHGDTREQALSRLDTALAQTHIVGLSTNVQFLRHVVQSRSFAQADLDTALIPREQAVLFKQEKVGLRLAVAAAIAHTLLQEKTLEAQATQRAVWLDPWARQDGWRSHGPSARRFDYAFQDVVQVVQLTTRHDGALQLEVAGEVGVFSFAPVTQGIDVRFADQRQIVNVYTHGAVAHVFTAQGAAEIIAVDALAHAGDAQSEGGRLTAPMPGKVVSFAVKTGDKVTKGQPLAVMDAMKMEHTIAAPADGVVAELLYAPGDQVPEGAELLKLVAA
jgi:3-methylcrotonyl-CoA carboxylase alpha subunit